MNLDACVLIDIGGTAIKYGVADFNGNFLYKKEMGTQARQFGGAGIVAKVKNIIREALVSFPGIKHVAVSTAGMVDPESCEIVFALPDAIPDYTGVNFKQIIKEEFNLEAWVENDVNCAALGELWLGAGAGCRSVFCMTIGTSVGGAMICDGKLVHGVSFSAGEIAYMRIPGGTLHELASTTFLVKYYASLSALPPEKVNGILIFDQAESGDPLAVEAVDMLIEHLTDGIANVVSVQNPQCVILGGGIMARSVYLRPRIEKALKAKLKDVVFNATKVEFAALRNDAGMLGALFNLKQRINLNA